MFKRLFSIFATVLALIIATCFATATIPAQSAETDTALPKTCIPAPRGDQAWKDRFEALKTVAETPNVKIVFLGDSITHYWEREGKDVWAKNFAPLGAINLGISNDTTETLLWRLDNGNFPESLKPKLIVLMIGTNNWQNAPKDTALGVKAVLDKLEKLTPKTKVLLLAIFPRGANKDDPKRKTNDEVNKIIKTYADSKRVFWLDINKSFLEKDQTLSKQVFHDLLHPSEEGYKREAKAIMPQVKKLSSR